MRKAVVSCDCCTKVKNMEMSHLEYFNDIKQEELDFFGEKVKTKDMCRDCKEKFIQEVKNFIAESKYFY